MYPPSNSQGHLGKASWTLMQIGKLGTNRILNNHDKRFRKSSIVLQKSGGGETGPRPPFVGGPALKGRGSLFNLCFITLAIDNYIGSSNLDFPSFVIKCIEKTQNLPGQLKT